MEEPDFLDALTQKLGDFVKTQFAIQDKWRKSMEDRIDSLLVIRAKNPLPNYNPSCSWNKAKNYRPVPCRRPNTVQFAIDNPNRPQRNPERVPFQPRPGIGPERDPTLQMSMSGDGGPRCRCYIC